MEAPKAEAELGAAAPNTEGAEVEDPKGELVEVAEEPPKMEPEEAAAAGLPKAEVPEEPKTEPVEAGGADTAGDEVAAPPNTEGDDLEAPPNTELVVVVAPPKGEEAAVVAPPNTEPAPVEAAAARGNADDVVEEAGVPPKIDLFSGGDLMAVKMEAEEETAGTEEAAAPPNTEGFDAPPNTDDAEDDTAGEEPNIELAEVAAAGVSEGLATLTEAALSVLEGAEDDEGVKENGEPLLEEVDRDAAPKADVPLVDPPNMDPEDDKEGALEAVKDEVAELPPKGDPDSAVLLKIDFPESAAAPKTDPEEAAAGEGAPNIEGLFSALAANRPAGGLISGTSGVLDLDLSGVLDLDLSTTVLEATGRGEAVSDLAATGVADLDLALTSGVVDLALAAGGPAEVFSGVVDLALARGEEAARPENIVLLEAGDDEPNADEAAAALAPKGDAVAAAVPKGEAAALAPNGEASPAGFDGVRENAVEAPPPKPKAAGFAAVSGGAEKPGKLAPAVLATAVLAGR